MTFRQLEYLDALAQCGSITKAAERLFVSQSALSQQIISIEKEHQIQILDRTQKPFTFTETGKTFLKAAQEILEIKRKLEEDLHLRWNNSLYIKTVPFYGMKLVPMLLSKFHYERPEIHVSLESDWAPTLFQSMPRDSVDFFFHAFDMEPFEPLVPEMDGWQHEVLFEEEILVAASSSHPLVKRLPKILDASGWATIALSDLENMMFMLPSTSPRLRDIACRYLGSAASQRLHIVEKGFDDMIAQLQYSDYFAFLPDTAVHFCSAAVGVQFFRIREFQIRRPVVASFRSEAKLSDPARQFFNIAKKNLADL